MHMEQITKIIRKDERIKYINIIKQYKIWLTMMALQTKMQKKIIQTCQVLDHPYWVIIIVGSGSGKEVPYLFW